LPATPFRAFDRKAALAIASAFTILLVVALFANYRLRGFEAALGRVDHTHEVIEQLGITAHGLVDAESAQRTYLLSGDPVYRADFEQSAATVPVLLRQVRTLTDDDPAQQIRLDTLEMLARAKLAELATTVRLRDDVGFPAARAAVLAHLRHPLMAEFDALLARMVATEQGLLAERDADRMGRLARLNFNLKLSMLMALFIAAFAAFRVQRAGHGRVAAERERDARTREVAMQSAELSAQNEELIAQGEALQLAMELAEGANRAKSDFLAQMSHELRTPLNSVIGFANIVRRNPRGVLIESELTYLDRVVENGRHLLRIINSILDLSKIEAKQESVEMELVSLPDLAREVLASLETQAAAAQITLMLEAPASVTSIVTDRDKLRRVLINLVANAVKFTKAGSVTVRIETSRRAPTIPVAIEVRDTGIGIAPNRLAAIFDAFEQGDIGVGREYGGTGLGLSISRALSQLLHYDLSVSSTLGVGSVFRVSFGAITS
jgi:signal transduction histidine kinase